MVPETLTTDAQRDPVTPDPVPRIEPEGRRSRKKQQTRNDLIDAAYDLFARHGFDETTTSEIADIADVSQRTLFRYFPTKEAVLYGDMDDVRFELRREFANRPVGEAVLTSVQESILASLFADFAQHADRRLLQVRLAASYASVSAHFRSVVQASWEREIIVAVANRLGVDPMDDPRPEIVAGASMSAVRAATRQWTASEGLEDYAALTMNALHAIGSLSDLS